MRAFPSRYAAFHGTKQVKIGDVTGRARVLRASEETRPKRAADIPGIIPMLHRSRRTWAVDAGNQCSRGSRIARHQPHGPTKAPASDSARVPQQRPRRTQRATSPAYDCDATPAASGSGSVWRTGRQQASNGEGANLWITKFLVDAYRTISRTQVTPAPTYAPPTTAP